MQIWPSRSETLDIQYTSNMTYCVIAPTTETHLLSIEGSEGDVIGILDFWVRLFPPSEPVDTLIERGVDRMTERGADRRIERGAGRMTERGADRWIERGADRMTDRLMDRRTISPQRQWSPIWAQRGLGLEDSVREVGY